MAQKHIEFDITIIGAGVVGLSIAKTLAEQGKSSVLVIEKNESFGQETSSRNSEVIHSGIFNHIDSIKYQFCVKGEKLLYDFCDQNKVWVNQCGKMIVSEKHEQDNFENFVHTLEEEEFNFDILNSQQTQKLEPSILSDQSILINNSGIVDSHGLMNQLYRISSNHHTYIFGSTPVEITKENEQYHLTIQRKHQEIEHIKSRVIINAAGLQSYKIAHHIMGEALQIPTMQFYKGSYFSLSPQWTNKFNRLIYSLPSDNDSLGIHVGFDSTGKSKLGPDYEYVEEDTWDYSVNIQSKEQFYALAKNYIKNLDITDLHPDYAGVRPKLFHSSNQFSDFYIQEESENGYPNLINLIGIDSPGLTSCLSIGEYVYKFV